MKKNKSQVFTIVLAMVIGLGAIGFIVFAIIGLRKTDTTPVETYEEYVPKLNGASRIEVIGEEAAHQTMDELLDEYSCIWLRKVSADETGQNRYVITYSHCMNEMEDCPYETAEACSDIDCTHDCPYNSVMVE